MPRIAPADNASSFFDDRDPLCTPSPCLDRILQNNRKWAAERVAEDPGYFSELLQLQAPEYLWIGCADSRVPANTILGLNPGEVFVQRNVGNQASHTDMNVMSCLEYAVVVLKVKTIICCGHYGCGAVKGALTMPASNPGLVNCWISDIRECRNQSYEELQQMTPEEQVDRLCELNVVRQTFKLCTSPVVQHAWEQGQELAVFGMIYNLKDGLIERLAGPLTKDNNAVMKFEEDLQANALALAHVVQRGAALRMDPEEEEEEEGVEMLIKTKLSVTKGIKGSSRSRSMSFSAASPASPDKMRGASSSTSSSTRDDRCSSPFMVRQNSFTNDIAKSVAQHVNWRETKAVSPH